MKKSILLFALLVFSFALFGCKDDDDSSTNNTTPNDPIVGTWVSDGDNVAILLRNFQKAKKITATFNADLTYTVVQIDSSDGIKTLTGTYELTKSESGSIHKIKVNQLEDNVLTAEGIYQINTDVEPDLMTYEVVQTEPSYGFTPPTVEAGFGSTNGGAFGTTNIQKFVRVQ